MFHMHKILNEELEVEANKQHNTCSFQSVWKVDTHVHHSACMTQTHLLNFMKNKLHHHGEDIVQCNSDGSTSTLAEVFSELHLNSETLTIDILDMHARDTFHRFDSFNLKYNPAGSPVLRNIFLKTDNYIEGRYLAEITQEVMTTLKQQKYHVVEWRLSIYGRNPQEWDKLSKWFYDNKLAHENVRWMIQVPRLFDIYKAQGILENFEELLKNIFEPLFAVSLNPSANVPLSHFLDTIVGFDSVDDESRPEFGHLTTSGSEHLSEPRQWNRAENPPYGYWLYYMYANIRALNELRAARGMNTFELRPHCGEAGQDDHLVSAYLLANKINHGIRLRKVESLQFLYYLSQIGIAVSPLSNNLLFLNYQKNPFIVYFRQGLNVSLSTDDPLILHHTNDPLCEEYAVATQVWKLSTADKCEIARNRFVCGETMCSCI
jgi:AMP deaminase